MPPLLGAASERLVVCPLGSGAPTAMPGLPTLPPRPAARKLASRLLPLLAAAAAACCSPWLAAGWPLPELAATSAAASTGAAAGCGATADCGCAMPPSSAALPGPPPRPAAAASAAAGPATAAAAAWAVSRRTMRRRVAGPSTGPSASLSMPLVDVPGNAPDRQDMCSECDWNVLAHDTAAGRGCGGGPHASLSMPPFGVPANPPGSLRLRSGWFSLLRRGANNLAAVHSIARSAWTLNAQDEI